MTLSPFIYSVHNKASDSYEMICTWLGQSLKKWAILLYELEISEQEFLDWKFAKKMYYEYWIPENSFISHLE